LRRRLKRAVGPPGYYRLFLAFNQLGDCGHQSSWNDHNRLATLPKGSFIFGDGFVFGLFLVMSEKQANSILVPPRWKTIPSIHFFLLIRLRYASGVSRQPATPF